MKQGHKRAVGDAEHHVLRIIRNIQGSNAIEDVSTKLIATESRLAYCTATVALSAKHRAI